jgi:hypothetical protein
MSGFYPAYREYVKALYHPEWQSAWMVDGAVAKILKPYDLELSRLAAYAADCLVNSRYILLLDDP